MHPWNDPFRATLLLTWQLIVLITGLLASWQASAIERIEISIGELENAKGRATELSTTIAFKRENQLAMELISQSLALLPPYDWLHAFRLVCSSFTMDPKETICSHGNLIINHQHANQFTLPFQLKQASSAQSGELNITAIPFAKNTSQLQLKWHKPAWTLRANINALNLKPLTDAFARFGVGVTHGQVDLNGEIVMTATNHANSNLHFSGKTISLQTEDSTKAFENLNVESTLQARTAQELTDGNFELQIRDGELYLEPIYLPLTDASISANTQFQLDTHRNQLQLIDFSLFYFPTMSFFGTLTTDLQKPFPPESGNLKIQVYNLENLFNYFIAPFLNTTGPKPVLSNTQGLILSELDFSDQQLVHATLLSANLSATYTFNHQDISVENARISLNWKPDHCDEQSFVYWKKAHFRGLPLPETVLRFTACGQQLNFERNVTLPLLDGEMRFDHLDLTRLETGAIDFSFATEINNISLAALTEAFDLPPLAGHLSASIPSVTLEKGGLRMDSSIHINVFGGTIEIRHLQIDGMLGSYPILTTDIQFKKLDLGKLSKRFSFGNIEGKLNGSITGLRIENGQVVAFNAEFSTPDNRLLPYTISQKAVENIASLGGSSPGDLLSRGVLKLFESFFYQQLGFRCRLRNNVCELHGIAAADNHGFYLIKGMLAPQINVIGYNHQVNWSELVARLKRISSQSSPVIH